MIIYTVAVVVRPDQLDRATAMFTDLAHASRQVTGVISFDILQDPADPYRFVSIEVFHDQAAVDRQSALPQTITTLTAFDDLLTSRPVGTIYHAHRTGPWPTEPGPRCPSPDRTDDPARRR